MFVAVVAIDVQQRCGGGNVEQNTARDSIFQAKTRRGLISSNSPHQASSLCSPCAGRAGIAGGCCRWRGWQRMFGGVQAESCATPSIIVQQDNKKLPVQINCKQCLSFIASFRFLTELRCILYLNQRRFSHHRPENLWQCR